MHSEFEEKQARRIEVSIIFEDGSERKAVWVGDTREIRTSLKMASGFPKVEMGETTLTVSRWPSMSFASPGTARSGDGA